MLVAALALVMAYLIGAVPFGWLIARSRGIDIFLAGSGNIGATNVGRILGRRFGLFVFGLDFAKGTLPVVGAGLLPPDAQAAFGVPDSLRVGVALCAFLGHLFPIYLGFRGGKGAATGAGTVLVLMPGPAAIAILVFAAVVGTSRIVSLGSITATGALCAARLFSVPEPFGRESMAVTWFCLAGTALIVVKHRANVVRLMRGTENRLEDKPMFDAMTRAIHVLSLGLWFGAAAMFNLIVAPTQFFEAFPAVVESAPSDRTANLPLALGASDEQKKQLATALAGSAVGPVFPKFFQLQAVCAALALITSIGWWQRPGRVHRCRAVVVGLAALTIAIGWPLSIKVSILRAQRFDLDVSVAEAAKTAFTDWHLVSLLLSMVTLGLAGTALALAAGMPRGDVKSLGSTES
jgi:acyl phosphate:glycerol-3-phosphate acyltransferase